MEIMLADYSGFCFGVKKAVSTAYENANNSGHVFTYGPIIHNSTVVRELEEKGVRQLTSTDELEQGDTVIIRSHGISKNEMDLLEDKKLNIINATCPYVENIHRKVEDSYRKKYKIVIVGDPDHPEVRGINGWCENTADIVNNEEDAKNVKLYNKICIVSQTTMQIRKWKALLNILADKSKELLIFNTICNATEQRQKSAEDIAKKADAVIVLGGYDSSNTKKLVEICKMYCDKTYHVENINELDMKVLKGVNILGITAGASTPDWIIKEAIDKMNFTGDTYDKNSEQSVMMDEYEKTLVRIHPGDVIKGRIIYVTDDEATVDIGYKADGVISKEELTFEGNISPKDILKPDDVIDVYVLMINDGEGNVVLSKKKVDAEKNVEYIGECFNNKTVVDARVTQIVKGGVIAEVKGVNVFIPASQLAKKYVEDLSVFANKNMRIVITAFEPERRRVVGSRKAVLFEEEKVLREHLLETIKPGDIITGTVCRLTDFGAFVDLGGIDGLIHISELSWTRVKHPKDVVKEGQKVEVYVISVDQEKERISLSLRRTVPEPWESMADKINVGDVVEGTVVRIAPFGAFVEVSSGVDGLVHISQISDKRINKVEDVLKVGDVIKAKVMEFSVENKKLSLSMKELIENEEKQENKEFINAQSDENVTIQDMVEKKEEE